VAKCDLTIELDEPERTHIGGEPIKGTVVVRAEQNVSCKGLDVACVWATHGRGNVARGESESKTLFAGNWDAGLEYRYPFELQTAAWPPTYYGTYLNVSHLIEARAKLPWSFDPKASVEFPVVATTSPEDLTPVNNKKGGSSFLGWVVGILLLIIFIPLLFVALGMALVFILPIALIGGGLFWFFRVFLPSRVTGPVECDVQPPRVAAGESLKGNLKFTPPRDLKVNGIHWKITAKEQCVSGSGSNRTTHTHKVLEKTRSLAHEGQLSGGLPQSFEFDFPLAANSPPSLKFTDNELIWEGELRIDIPKWPDWVKTFKLTVTPGAAPAATQEPVAKEPAAALPPSDSDLSFDDVAKQILMSEDDPARRQLVIDAVQGQAFSLRADLESRLGSLEAPSNGAGTWLLGHHHGSGLALAILWPDSASAPWTPLSGWQGVATVAGYDTARNRVVMRAAV
jgi:hypothetical protein